MTTIQPLGQPLGAPTGTQPGAWRPRPQVASDPSKAAPDAVEAGVRSWEEVPSPPGPPPRIPGRMDRPWLEPLPFGPDTGASALTRTYTREGVLVAPEEGGVDLFRRRRPMLDVLG